MGAIIRQDCPYCRTSSVAFQAKFDWRTTNNNQRSLLNCGSCGEGIIREYAHKSGLMQFGGDVTKHNVTLGRQWPEARAGNAPADSPKNAAKFFEQGTSSLEIGNFDAAGMMFRKVVESATKALDPDLGKKKLVQRIEALAKAGKLTDDLAHWAHEVRLGGNDAAHDDEPFTLEEAEDIRNFVENFLRYAFTLPSAVKRRGGGADKGP